MKKVFLTLLLISGALLSSLACEFEFKVDEKSKKDLYATGDEVVIHVKCTFTHRVCNVAIKDTKFDTEGFKILGATDWKETKPGVWERKMKLKVSEPKKGKSTLSATRKCDKEGGFGTISVNVKA